MGLFEPETGRKHQIRLHAARVLGQPIIGDYKYGTGISDRIKGMVPTGKSLPMQLHLARLVVRDYHGPGRDLVLESGLPPHFKRLLGSVGLMGKLPW